MASVTQIRKLRHRELRNWPWVLSCQTDIQSHSQPLNWAAVNSPGGRLRHFLEIPASVLLDNKPTSTSSLEPQAQPQPCHQLFVFLDQPLHLFGQVNEPLSFTSRTCQVACRSRFSKLGEPLYTYSEGLVQSGKRSIKPNTL